MSEQTTQQNPLNVEIFMTGSNSWQEGTIIDITNVGHSPNVNNLFIVRLNDGNESEVNLNQLRQLPKRQQQTSMQPEKFIIGEQVEVYCQANNDILLKQENQVQSKGWKKGSIVNSTDDYYMIEFDMNNYPEQIDQIFHRFFLRKFINSPQPNIKDFQKAEIEIPQTLLYWSQNFHNQLIAEQKAFYDQLHSFTQKANVYGIQFNRDKTHLIIIGPQQNLKQASSLTDVFLNHQRQMFELDQKVNHKMTQLDKNGFLSNGNHGNEQLQMAQQKTNENPLIVEEIFVERNLVAVIIGKQGKNIQDIENRHGVRISIDSGEQFQNNLLKKVRITGKDRQSVESAKLEVYLKREQISVETSLIDYVCGENDENLRYFESRSKVVSLNVLQNKEGQIILEAIGTQTQIDELNQLISQHLDYKDQYFEKQNKKQTTQSTHTTSHHNQCSGDQNSRQVIYNPQLSQSQYSTENSHQQNLQQQTNGHEQDHKQQQVTNNQQNKTTNGNGNNTWSNQNGNGGIRKKSGQEQYNYQKQYQNYNGNQQQNMGYQQQVYYKKKQ